MEHDAKKRRPTSHRTCDSVWPRMILIGQYDSPFVRRVGIALHCYGITFEHRPWSVFRDAAKIQTYNPLLRVPTLVLDDGTVLIESHNMLDYLDSQVAPSQAMFPRTEPARHQALKIAALATGMADKAVSLFYEQRLHTEVSEVWRSRCQAQVRATLDVLETERTRCTTPWWFGETFGHADIAVAACLRFVNEAHPALVAIANYPALAAHAARMEASPAFAAIVQPFIPPA